MTALHETPVAPARLETDPVVERETDPEGNVTGRRVFPWGWSELGMLVAAFVVLSAVYVPAGFVVTEWLDGWVATETDASEWVEGERTDAWTEAAEWGSFLSDTIPKFAAIVILVAVFVWVWRRWHDAVFLAATMLLEVSVFGFVARVVDRDRPPIEQLDGAPTQSFPSGHAAAAVAFYVTIAIIMFWHTRRTWVRAAFVALAVLAPVAVVLSRFYLGMHYISDLVAGTTLGALSLLVVRHVVERGVAKIDPDAPPHTRRLDLTEPAPASGSPR